MFGKPDVVMVHTFCPKKSIIPPRGRLVADTGYNLAKRFNVPLLMTVGKTVQNESRKECEVYRDFLFMTRDRSIKIITGEDSNIRDTFMETSEALRLCQKLSFKKILIVGLHSHISLRAKKFWKKSSCKQNIEFDFVFVKGPIKYYFWELLMLILEIPFPPRSWRRDLIFNLVGRKG